MAKKKHDANDPSLKSWIESANTKDTEFPIQNLAMCCFFRPGDDPAEGALPTCGVRIGESVIDLWELVSARLFDDLDGVPYENADIGEVLGLGAPNLSLFAQNPKALRVAFRNRLSEVLRHDTAALRDNPYLRAAAVFDADQVDFAPPTAMLNYTDFYASIHHATTVGTMFRPDNPLLPNYKWVPIGYHGRPSSIVVSGEAIRRPIGQQAPADGETTPGFGPCKLLDYELEVGCYIAEGNELGTPISIKEARERIFGLCLVNDWSARDIQKWEYQPLGPFLSKSFATTVSPYIVTAEALDPFRCAAFKRAKGDPAPLPYLSDSQDQKSGGFDITLDVYLETEQMRKAGKKPHRISSGRGFKDMYWTFAQMIAHHTVNGCNFHAGDLIASGTVSGPGPTQRGCLLESTWDGPGKPRKAVELPGGEKRTFLQDGDTVILRGFCEREGFKRIGFGECRGTVMPAGV